MLVPTERLIETARRLFRERGYEGARVELIADEADVSVTTFFRYFDSKEDVVIGFFDDMGLELREMLAARPRDEPPFTALRGALGSLVDTYEERQIRVVAAKRLAHETPSIRARLLDKHARWENWVTEVLNARTGSRTDEQRSRLIASVGLAAYGTAVNSWCTTEGRDDLHALVDEALREVGRGFDRPA